MKHLFRLLLALIVTGSLMSTAKAQSAEELRSNLVVVLDASGSMDGGMTRELDKMAGAKIALKVVLRSLPPDVHVGLVVFGANKQGWYYELGPRDAAKLDAAIDQVRTGGNGTPLGEYIKIGGDKLVATMEKQHGYGQFKLLVVTDGEADGHSPVDEYARDVVSRGITLDVIGVKMDSAHSLKKIARIYRDASNPDAIVEAGAAILVEVTSVTSTDNPYEVVSAAFSAESTPAIIRALSSTGYHPIGEQPRAPVTAGTDTSGTSSSSPSSGSSGSTTSSGGCGLAHSDNNATMVGLLSVLVALSAVGARRRGRVAA